MIVSSQGSVWNLIKWQWRSVAYFAGAGLLAALNHHYKWFPEFIVPPLPMGIVGGALGIFVSFRTNSSYDRWWEGRKLWGRMINSSRHFATQVLSYLPRDSQGKPSKEQRQLIHRHIAYVHMLRLLLRQQAPFEDPDLTARLADDEQERIANQSNKTHALLQMQSDQLAAAMRRKDIGSLELQLFDKTIEKLLDIQGGCERIKKTPLPRGYGFIAERLIAAYALLFPWVLVHEIGWWIIPLNILICLSFALISEAGRVLEDPFTLFWNGLPLFAISRMIEVNLRERLEETDLPPLMKANQNGVLM